MVWLLQMLTAQRVERGHKTRTKNYQRGFTSSTSVSTPVPSKLYDDAMLPALSKWSNISHFCHMCLFLASLFWILNLSCKKSALTPIQKEKNCISFRNILFAKTRSSRDDKKNHSTVNTQRAVRAGLMNESWWYQIRYHLCANWDLRALMHICFRA